MKRDILNYLGEKIGELELPDNTSEDIWLKKLAPYAVAPPSPQEITNSYLTNTIDERIRFSTDLMERLKKKHIVEGINALQGLWMHHKMRALPVSFMGMNFTIDLLNLVISGDVEIATIALIYSEADDMSQPYHWLSQDRKNWIIAELKAYLGWS